MSRRSRSASALLAILMAGALAASTARADPPMFHLEPSGGAIEGANLTSIQAVAAGLTATCKKGKLSGEAPETTTTLTLRPEFSECSTALSSVTVVPHSCHLTWHLGAAPTATVDVSCEKAGDAITVEGPGCKVTIAPQEAISHVVFKNTTPGGAVPMDIDAAFTMTGIGYTATGLFCPESGVKTNGQMIGEFTVRRAGGGSITVF